MRRITTVFVLILLAFLSSYSAYAQSVPCGLLTAEFPQPGPNMYSTEEEKGIGKQRVSELAMGLSRVFGRRVQVFKDQQISEFLEPLLKKILAQFPSYAQEFTYEIYLYDHEVLNAMAAPGGPIALSLGAIIDTPSDDYLAFVLAHEVAHVALRHETRLETLKKLYTLEDNLLLRTISPSTSPPFTYDEVRVLMMLRQDAQSRLQMLTQQAVAHESEADFLSVRVGVRAGFNPKSIIEQHSKEAEGQKRGWVDGSAHPHGFLRSLMFSCSAPEHASPERISPELQRAKEAAVRRLPKFEPQYRPVPPEPEE